MAALLEPTPHRDGDRSRAQPTLQSALLEMDGDSPLAIPWLVRLLENPASPVALPGKIDLYGHDCLHVLLNRGLTVYDEAFVVGFTMGNDPKTRAIHLAIFKFFSSTLYPHQYRFDQEHLKIFDLGILYGRMVPVKNLNQIDFQTFKDQKIESIRHQLGIDLKMLQLLLEIETGLVCKQ